MDKEIDLQTIIKDIPMYRVSSSNISAIGYNNTTRVLRVIFSSGSSYLYFEVEPIMWDALIKSPSKGSFLSQNIVKNKSKYKCIKI